MYKNVTGVTRKMSLPLHRCCVGNV